MATVVLCIDRAEAGRLASDDSSDTVYVGFRQHWRILDGLVVDAYRATEAAMSVSAGHRRLLDRYLLTLERYRAKGTPVRLTPHRMEMTIL